MTTRDNYYRKPGNRVNVPDDLTNRPADKQINKIIAIARYKFHWGRKAIFNYICESVHDAGIRVTIEDAKHYKYSALLQTLTTAEKSLVIKRLEQIEKRNGEAVKMALADAAGAVGMKIKDGVKAIGKIFEEVK